MDVTTKQGEATQHPEDTVVIRMHTEEDTQARADESR